MTDSLTRVIVNDILKTAGLNKRDIHTAIRLAADNHQIALAGAVRIESRNSTLEQFILSVFKHFQVDKQKLVKEWAERIETAQWVLNIVEQLDSPEEKHVTPDTSEPIS